MAREAYDNFAAVYDQFNSANNYEMWLGDVLLPELERHGLRTGRALDVGCGTGRAFEPLLSRGWEVIGCDVSTGMLAEAKRKFGSRVRLLEADGVDLPQIDHSKTAPGRGFDLILLLNEVVNYMTEDGDLERAFAGVRRNLHPSHGLVVFDTATASWMRDVFASGRSEEMSARGWEWHGLSQQAVAGSTYEAQLSGRSIVPHVHRERHWTPAQVREAVEAAGLRHLALLGQREADGRVLLAKQVDEERDAKIIHLVAAS